MVEEQMLRDAAHEEHTTPPWQEDFYGAPAYIFWMLCIALGLIAGILAALR